MLGALQVAAMRHRRTPGINWWRAHKLKPNPGTYVLRWGSWNAAIKAAGLTPAPTGRVAHHTTDSCVAAVRALASHIGKRPSRDDWDANREWLRAEGFPTSHDTLARLMGSWSNALRAAGFE